MPTRHTPLGTALLKLIPEVQCGRGGQWNTNRQNSQKVGRVVYVLYLEGGDISIFLCWTRKGSGGEVGLSRNGNVNGNNVNYDTGVVIA